MSFTTCLLMDPSNTTKFPLNSHYNTDIPLRINGQCTFSFYVTDGADNVSFKICDDKRENGLEFLLTEKRVIMKQMIDDNSYHDPNNKSGIEHIDGIFYWVSLDSGNQRVYVGIGEARIETQIYCYRFSRMVRDSELWKRNKQFLESLSQIVIDDVCIQPIKLLRLPISETTSLLIKDKDELTMNDVALDTYIPDANLPKVTRQLYDCVSGRRFVLDNESFPDFSKAIEHSIVTPGCWCYKKLQEKQSEFNPNDPNINATYLRITLGVSDGNSPGIPYVMEIWPIGHYSPIHNHAGSDAIIRVLHGKIDVELYPFLSAESEKVPPFAEQTFYKGDITWLSSNMNQYHRLKNSDTSTRTCITIQCYMYSDDDNIHYDYFDYVSDDNTIEHYDPDSDMDFIRFKETMRKEWKEYKQSITFTIPDTFWC